MDGTSINALKQQQRRTQINMKLLAKDIEDSLVNNSKTVSPIQPRQIVQNNNIQNNNKQTNYEKYEQFQDDLDEPDNNNHPQNNNQKKEKPFNFKKFIREPLLLLVIYLIFSIDNVQDMVAKKIPQILPSPSGQVSYLGKLIYGLILVVTFIGARYVVNLRD